MLQVTANNEDQAGWEAVFRLGSTCLELDEEGTGCMSDRAKGISGALEAQLPKVRQFSCIKHLASNLKQLGKGTEVDMKALVSLAYVRNAEMFELKQEDMKANMKAVTVK